MNTFLTLWRRELGAYFFSPIAYVMAIFFLVVEGFSFWFLVRVLTMGRTGVPVMSQLFGSLFFWIPFLVVVPVLTMRLFAEEKRSGTIETLMTAPVTDLQVVLAKFFGAFTFYLLMWTPTISYAFILRRFSAEATPIDLGPMMGGYLGALLIGAFYISVGLFCSALTRNQIVSAIMTFSIMCVLFFAGFLHMFTDQSLVQLLSSYGASILHMLDFSRGTVDTRPVVLYLSCTAFVLFCTLRMLETRRW
jgi:ABC-2 type transport system permease protein